MQSNVLNDLAKAKRRRTEKKFEKRWNMSAKSRFFICNVVAVAVFLVLLGFFPFFASLVKPKGFILFAHFCTACLTRAIERDRPQQRKKSRFFICRYARSVDFFWSGGVLCTFLECNGLHYIGTRFRSDLSSKEDLKIYIILLRVDGRQHWMDATYCVVEISLDIIFGCF